MDDPRLGDASGGSADMRYPWMRHIPPPPAEGRVTPPKPMKPWGSSQDHHPAATTASTTTNTAPPTAGRPDDVIVIPRPFAFNPDVRKEELQHPFKDLTEHKAEVPPDADHPSANAAFDKGFVRELEKIDGISVKCGGGGGGGSGGGSGGGGGGNSSSGGGGGANAGVVACLGSGLKPRINCEFCEQTFSRREGLKRHEITAHTDIRNFKCVECPQTFARKDKLKRHVETVHMTEKRFECETCGKGFNRKDKLQKHLHSDKAHVGAAHPMKPNTLNKATQEPPLTPETENNLRKDFETQKKLEEEERKKLQAVGGSGGHTQHQSSQTSQTSANAAAAAPPQPPSTTTNPHHQHHHHHHQHLPHQMNEYSDSARAFLETLSQRLNTDLPVFP